MRWSEHMIEKIVNKIADLLRDGYPYSALGMALTLPDICGNNACPGTTVANHYIKWYNSYVVPSGVIQAEKGFRSIDGEFCYKLRCAYLHSGNFELGNGEHVKDIEKFTIHYSQDPDLRFTRIVQTADGKYRMDIDLGVFCWQLCVAAKKFYDSNKCECRNMTIEIKDTTPTEKDQKDIRRRIEEKSGLSLEAIKEIKRKDSTFEIEIDL